MLKKGQLLLPIEKAIVNGQEKSHEKYIKTAQRKQIKKDIKTAHQKTDPKRHKNSAPEKQQTENRK